MILDKFAVGSLRNPCRSFHRETQLRAAISAAPDLREWVLQRFVDDPMLIDGRKFHLRVYALCVGDLELHICDDILALFSLEQYPTQETEAELGAERTRKAQITNSCVQLASGREEEERAVKLWSGKETLRSFAYKDPPQPRVCAPLKFIPYVCLTLSSLFFGQSCHQRSPPPPDFRKKNRTPRLQRCGRGRVR